MAGEIQLNSVTLATESGGVITLENVNSATNRTNLGVNTTNIGAVPTSRTISNGSGISGGGDLSANRTLAVSFSANQSQVKTALNASGSAPIYACRAWVNFKGTGTVAIRASGNVSSITDNGGSGDYTVNFTTAMPDANYSPISLVQSNGSIYDGSVIKDGVALLTTSIRIQNCNVSSGTGRDPVIFSVSIFR